MSRHTYKFHGEQQHWEVKLSIGFWICPIYPNFLVTVTQGYKLKHYFKCLFVFRNATTTKNMPSKTFPFTLNPSFHVQCPNFICSRLTHSHQSRISHGNPRSSSVPNTFNNKHLFLTAVVKKQSVLWITLGGTTLAPSKGEKKLDPSTQVKLKKLGNDHAVYEQAYIVCVCMQCVHTYIHTYILYMCVQNTYQFDEILVLIEGKKAKEGISKGSEIIE